MPAVVQSQGTGTVADETLYTLGMPAGTNDMLLSHLSGTLWLEVAVGAVILLSKSCGGLMQPIAQMLGHSKLPLQRHLTSSSIQPNHSCCCKCMSRLAVLQPSTVQLHEHDAGEMTTYPFMHASIRAE